MYSHSTNKLVRAAVVVSVIGAFGASGIYVAGVLFPEKKPFTEEMEQESVAVEAPGAEDTGAGRAPASLGAPKVATSSPGESYSEGGREEPRGDGGGIISWQSSSYGESAPSMGDARVPWERPVEEKEAKDEGKKDKKDDAVVGSGGAYLPVNLSRDGGSSSSASSGSSTSSGSGGSSTTVVNQQPRHMFASTGGGLVYGTTGGGYQVSGTSGSSLSGVMGTTGSGYKIWLNSLGQEPY